MTLFRVAHAVPVKQRMPSTIVRHSSIFTRSLSSAAVNSKSSGLLNYYWLACTASWLPELWCVYSSRRLRLRHGLTWKHAQRAVVTNKENARDLMKSMLAASHFFLVRGNLPNFNMGHDHKKVCLRKHTFLSSNRYSAHDLGRTLLKI